MNDILLEKAIKKVFEDASNNNLPKDQIIKRAKAEYKRLLAAEGGPYEGTLTAREKLDIFTRALGGTRKPKNASKSCQKKLTKEQALSAFAAKIKK